MSCRQGRQSSFSVASVLILGSETVLFRGDVCMLHKTSLAEFDKLY